MADEKRLNGLYKNILGDTKATIEAIQRYISENSRSKEVHNEVEEMPADSINRVLKAVACEDTQKDIAAFLKRI